MKNLSPSEFVRNQAKICCLLPFIVSLYFIFIWFFVPGLGDVASATMKLNTGIGLCLASCSLWLQKEEEKTKLYLKRLAQFLALIVFLLGLLTYIQYMYSFNLGIDEFFKKDLLNNSSKMVAGRMSINAAGAFVFLGLSLMLLDLRIKKVHIATLLLIPLFVSTLFSILGYLYDEALFGQINPDFRVTLPASLCFWVLSIGALSARIESGPLNVLVSQGLGGVTARRLLPFLTIAPILLNYVRLKFEAGHVFSFEIGFSIFSMSLLILLMGALLFTARRLDHTFFKKLELKEKEQLTNLRLNMVLDATKVGIYEWTSDTELFTWNPYHEMLFGYEPGTPNRPMEDFFRRVHYNDLTRILTSTEQALKNKADFEYEFRIVLPSGELKWIYSRGRFSYDDGTTPILRGIVIDISKLKSQEQKIKESEDKFRTIINTVPQMVWTCAATGEAEYFNQQWLKFTGATEIQCLGSSWLNFVHPDDRDKLKEQWCVALKEKSLFQTEYRLRSSDGEYHWMLGRALPLRSFQGEVTQWFGTSTEIESLKQAEDRLKQAINARDEFLSITSHELKTPLTALSLQTDIIKMNIQSGQYKNMSEKQLYLTADLIDKQITRLNHLINDMLDVTRIRSGHLSLNKQSFDLGSLAVEVIDRLRPMFFAGHTELIYENPTESIEIEADKIRIDQILTNLLTNALRYGKAKPVIVKIKRHNSKILISVQDHGIGIDKDDRERIFNRFERASAESSVAGIGLGLFIVKELVHIHGGKIWLESERGKGSTFFIEI